ncbi:MAG: hypothetical protein ACJ796_08905 [Gemmatimonadaceae bacterium]
MPNDSTLRSLDVIERLRWNRELLRLTLDELTARIPLTMCGWVTGPHTPKATHRCRSIELSEYAQCLAWLACFGVKTKTLGHTTSYGWKHVVESHWSRVSRGLAWTGCDWHVGYVSNGAFTAAAVTLGYATRHDTSWSVRLNLKAAEPDDVRLCAVLPRVDLTTLLVMTAERNTSMDVLSTIDGESRAQRRRNASHVPWFHRG